MAGQQQLEWGRYTDGSWCRLNSVNLEHQAFGADGNYVIWYFGDPGRVVYCGQGNLRDRLTAHQRDPRIQAYANHDLHVTWAYTSGSQRDGIEGYLASAYPPLVGERHPDVPHIPVNPPWG